MTCFYCEGAQNILTGSGALLLTEQAAAVATARYLQNLDVDVGQMLVIATNSQSILQSIYCKIKCGHGNMQPVYSEKRKKRKRRTAISLLTPTPVLTLRLCATVCLPCLFHINVPQNVFVPPPRAKHTSGSSLQNIHHSRHGRHFPRQALGPEQSQQARHHRALQHALQLGYVRAANHPEAWEHLVF